MEDKIPDIEKKSLFQKIIYGLSLLICEIPITCYNLTKKFVPLFMLFLILLIVPGLKTIGAVLLIFGFIGLIMELLGLDYSRVHK